MHQKTEPPFTETCTGMNDEQWTTSEQQSNDAGMTHQRHTHVVQAMVETGTDVYTYTFTVSYVWGMSDTCVKQDRCPWGP